MAELSFATPRPTQLPARLRQEAAPRPSRPSRTAAQLRTTGGGAGGRAARGAAVLARLGQPRASHRGRGWSRFRPQPPASRREQRRRRLHFPEGSVAGTWLQGGVAGARLIAPPLAPPALQVQGPLGGRHVLTGLAAAHAQVQTTVHPNNHPSPLCDPSSIWRFLSASCAGARWGCVDKKRPLSLIGCSHANPTLSG